MDNSVKRSKNFNHTEIDLLLSLVTAKKDTLECKKTDAVSVKEKEKAWKEIADTFNEISGSVLRDWKVLKVKYENLKKTCKRKLAEGKRYTLGTGGGPYEPNLITTTDIKIKEIIGTMPIEGLPSVCDSDSIVQPSLLSSTGEPSVIITNVPVHSLQNNNTSFSSLNFSQSQALVTNDDPCSTNEEIEKIPIVTQDNIQLDETEAVPCNSQFSASDLRKPTSTPIRVKRKRPSLDSTLAGKKLIVLLEEKQKLLQLRKKSIENQIKFQRVEHELKMKQMEEEHTAKMKLLELDIKIKELDIEVKSKQMT